MSSLSVIVYSETMTKKRRKINEAQIETNEQTNQIAKMNGKAKTFNSITDASSNSNQNREITAQIEYPEMDIDNEKTKHKT